MKGRAHFRYLKMRRYIEIVLEQIMVNIWARQMYTEWNLVVTEGLGRGGGL